MNVTEIAEYLDIRKSTIYSWVESREIPFYRLGKVIRFKRNDIDAWIEGLKSEVLNPQKVAKRIINKANKYNKIDIDRIVKKSIEQVKDVRYNPIHGRPDRIKGLGKEASNGTL